MGAQPDTAGRPAARRFLNDLRQARVLCELVEDPLVQERVTGMEFTADCLIDHDGNVSVIPRRRLTVRNGLAVAARTFHDNQVAKTVTRTVAALGMTVIIIRACCGSIVVGVIFCWSTIVAPMISGRMRTGRLKPGSVNRLSGRDRSSIQPKNGAWRRSIELCNA